MQPWATRIKERLDAGKSEGLSQVGLAKACGKSQPSINQWFNDTDSKPATAMIMADNLMAAAKYLGVSPVWIMTGRNEPSQAERLDADIIRRAIKLAEDSYFQAHNERLDLELDPVLFAQALKAALAQRGRMEGSGGHGFGSGDGEAGDPGGPARKEKDGEAQRPAASRTRKRAAG